jgi:hypothetical protein
MTSTFSDMITMGHFNIMECTFLPSGMDMNCLEIYNEDDCWHVVSHIGKGNGSGAGDRDITPTESLAFSPMSPNRLFLSITKRA